MLCVPGVLRGIEGEGMLARAREAGEGVRPIDAGLPGLGSSILPALHGERQHNLNAKGFNQKARVLL